MSGALNPWSFDSITLAKRLTFPSDRPKVGQQKDGRMFSADGILALIRVVLTLKGRLGTLFLASLINAVVFFSLTAMWITAREGNIRAAYQVLFEPSSSAAERERETRIAVAQAQLRQEVVNEAMIKEHLTGFLSRNSTAARVRIAIIHNGTVGVGDNHVWKFDIISAVAASGRYPGVLVQNESLVSWAHFLPELLAGRCVTYTVASMQRTAGRDRLEGMGVLQVLTCPIRMPTGELLGAMFTMYDRADDVPKGPELDRVFADAGNVSAGLAYALAERRGR